MHYSINNTSLSIDDTVQKNILSFVESLPLISVNKYNINEVYRFTPDIINNTKKSCLLSVQFGLTFGFLYKYSQINNAKKYFGLN